MEQTKLPLVSQSTLSNKLKVNQYVTIGLQWDVIPGEEVDLDLQCVLLNELGQIEDAVFYNQRQAKNCEIHLSEDSLGEKEGFDEVLTMNMKSIPFSVKYAVILACSYKGQSLQYIESSKVTVFHNSQQSDKVESNKKENILQEWMCGHGSKTEISAIPCLFQKEYDGSWSFTVVQEVGVGKNFDECEILIKKGLVKSGFDEYLFMECKNWKGNQKFNLDKRQTVPLPDSLKYVYVGLGWDTKCDVDASILLYNKEGALLENIYYGNKTSRNQSVKHSGDNLTGEGDGDDEVLTVDLNKIEDQVQTIWAVVTIYTNGFTFKDVKGAFCRLYSSANQEFCKYNLSDCIESNLNGCIMCCLSKQQQNQWTISPKGFFTQNSKISSQVDPIVRKLMVNDFTGVTISSSKKQSEIIQTIQPQQYKSTQPQARQSLEQPISQRKNSQISIIKVEGLRGMKKNGSSNPFAQIIKNGNKIIKTPKVKNNLSPEWYLDFSVQENDQIIFEFYNHHFILSDDFIGSCLLSVNAEMLTKQTIELSILDKTFAANSNFTGKLFVTLKSQ